MAFMVVSGTLGLTELGIGATHSLEVKNNPNFGLISTSNEQI